MDDRKPKLFSRSEGSVKPELFGVSKSRRATPQKVGRLREKQMAKELGGYAQPGSGCIPGKGGDVVLPDYLIEHKYTRALQYTVSIHTLRKIKREAAEQGRLPALALEISGQMMYEPEEWVMVPLADWKRLRKAVGHS